ncbi:hypothetical protein AMECASPLE_035451 [Ameca splendens]|uniref:Uncharacterized protein n=1 Tax=Ameca splendens TaxID=208324 RepID=A0ABV0XWE2_9TELE
MGFVFSKTIPDEPPVLPFVSPEQAGVYFGSFAGNKLIGPALMAAEQGGGRCNFKELYSSSWQHELPQHYQFSSLKLTHTLLLLPRPYLSLSTAPPFRERLGL